jgi:putative hemolysin
MDNPTQFLSTVQVGITSIGILNGIIGEAAFSEQLGALAAGPRRAGRAPPDRATAIVVAIITYVTILFGELVPKRIGQLYPGAVARLASRPMRWLAKAAGPFVKLLSASTQAMLKLLAIDTTARGHDRGGNRPQPGRGRRRRRDRAARAPDGAQRVPPRRPAAHLDDGAALRHRSGWTLPPVREACARRRRRAHSWYPVCRGSLDDVVGVVSVARC